MKNIKGILFDKDGTLLDFHSIWVPLFTDTIDELVKDLNIQYIQGIKDKLLQAIGIRSGKVEPFGVLAWGTLGEVTKELTLVLEREAVDKRLLLNLSFYIEAKINKLSKEKSKLIKPTGNLTRLFNELKKLHIYIGLATSDTYESARFCLKSLNVEEYFDFIGADDGMSAPKPSPDLLNKFCKACGLQPEEIAVVGDTEVDIALASNGNAALAIAVLSGTNGKETLVKGADFVLNSVDEIIDENGIFVWCKG
ncbi:HAD family hydrolase [Clostridium sp. DJ247]|uniref:HAD family hydrolase n=1 Tax=Clostridium sp. DJ247 TaxID=2726188 RepID=UPI00162742BF|nr:HAD family hydrolase [Clostridium sp. DJ247]MBC2579457.1 HAD family hydrolase [Clostridium sp. DJ247]